MPTPPHVIEDLLSLGGTLLSRAFEARHDMKAQAKNRANDVLRHFDLVTRDEFDAAFAMLTKARAMQEDLDERLTRLEKQISPKSAAAANKNHPKNQKSRLPSVKRSKRRAR